MNPFIANDCGLTILPVEFLLFITGYRKILRVCHSETITQKQLFILYFLCNVLADLTKFSSRKK